MGRGNQWLSLSRTAVRSRGKHREGGRDALATYSGGNTWARGRKPERGEIEREKRASCREMGRGFP